LAQVRCVGPGSPYRLIRPSGVNTSVAAMFGFGTLGAAPRLPSADGYRMQPQVQTQEQLGVPDGVVEGLVAGSGFVRCESMDIINDPRFFSNNVLDKRLAAFSGLGVVGGLMVGTALTECFSMKKNMDLATPDGVLQFVGFLLMNLVLFANLLATYASVAQVYFMYRLMTAGPTGFEISSGFYLSPNIAFWRHAAVKSMLISLPVFLLGSAFRMLVKFDRDMPGARETSGTIESVFQSRVYGVSVLGLSTAAVWVAFSILLFHVHSKHVAAFQEKYSMAKDMERPLMMQTMSHRSGSTLDM